MKGILSARKLFLGVIAAGVLAAVLPAVASAHTGTVAIGCTGVTYTFDNASFGYGGTSETQTIAERVYIDGVPTSPSATLVQINPSTPGTTTSTVTITVPADGASHTIIADAFDQTTGFPVQIVTLAPGQSSSGGYFPVTQPLSCTPHCLPGSKANFRWHYSANGSSGSWSGTNTQTCGSAFSMGPQDMEGDQKLLPGTTMSVGYDFTVPGNNSTLTFTVANPQVTFLVHCANGSTPSQSTWTVTMPTQSYTVTNSQWYPSGDQQSSLVYQGSATVPNACNGGLVRFDKGGTFSATLS